MQSIVNVPSNKIAVKLDCGNTKFASAFFLVIIKNPRRRIKTEAKAKVVASVWGTEFIQFLAAQGILY